MMFFIIKMSFVLLFWYIAGHYPEWDEDHPIHFVGHSAGAQVVRVLQQMLADKVSLDLNAMFFFLAYLDSV
jgi:predicted alpha/beta hydrolase